MYGVCGSNARASRRWVWVPLVVAAALVAVIVGGWLYFGAPGPAYANGPVYWWFPFGWFLLIPAFFLIFFGLRWFFWGWWGWGWGGWWYGGGYDPALETIRQRFARGEITKDQYDSMLRDLEAPRE